MPSRGSSWSAGLRPYSTFEVRGGDKPRADFLTRASADRHAEKHGGSVLEHHVEPCAACGAAVRGKRAGTGACSAACERALQNRYD